MTIVEKITKARKGHYVHALEVCDLYELEATVEALSSEFIAEGHTSDEISAFFNTLELYYLGAAPLEEEAVYNFDFDTFINDNI